MIWILPVIFFAALLTWILLGPVILFLETGTRRYHLMLPGVFKAAVIPAEELFQIRGWIFFIPFRFNPLKTGTSGKKENKSGPGKRRKGRSVSLRFLAQAIPAFRIRKLTLDLDTDDYLLNAWLIPVFSALNGDNIRLRSNFEGNLSLTLDLRTRLGALLWVQVRNRYRSLFNL